MGFAILGVMLGHLIQFKIHISILSDIIKLIHTYGFIFLSGFGLFFSYNKNPNRISFYKKRLFRLYLPFVFIALPFFILYILMGKDSVNNLFFHLSTITFWIKGNYYAMWYIALSVFLYMLFPLIYRMIVQRNMIITTIRVFSLVLLSFLVLFFIQFYYPGYWSSHKIGISKIPIFPIGIYIGYLASMKYRVKMIYLIPYFIICLLIMFFLCRYVDSLYRGFARTLIGIPIAVVSVDYMGNTLKKYVKIVFGFLGKYSLELYLIHVLVFYALRYSYFNDTINMAIGIIVSLLTCKLVNTYSHCLVSCFMNDKKER